MQDEDRKRHTRPPAGITVAEFFERWLPDTFAASGRRGPVDAPVVRASISGPGGGTWELQAQDDKLAVEAAAEGPGREAPDVWVRLVAADLLAALGAPDPDLPALLPPSFSTLDLLFLDPRDIELLRQVAGRVALEVEGRRRRRFRLDVGFGPAGVSAGRPRATVILDGATFEGLGARTVAPMQALLDGRVKVEGDRALAMQLLLLFASRLARP
jgi:hypothetical protein